ncbi:MAG: hypothetical protein QM808_16870 [Steroidobacteraceae bacterium]
MSRVPSFIASRYLPRYSQTHLRLLLLLAAPLLFGALAVLLGRESSWDLQNYHWYNAYALLHQRLGFDIAVAHHATYYNPLPDLPFYWVATHAQAWLAGAFLGAQFGVAVALIGAIAYQYLAGSPTLIRNVHWRMCAAAFIAVAGAVGGGAFPALGSTSNDVSTAIGIFIALWLLTWQFAELRSATLKLQLITTLLCAGICAGMSVGLKLTTAAYALGLLAASAWVPATWRKRGQCVLLLSIGMLLGFVVCAGPWLWRMWEYGRNPLFPYFNQLFHSPLLIDGSYRDTTYAVSGWRDQLLFPYLFTMDSYRVAEWHFRDARILAAYVLVPLSLLVYLLRKLRNRTATLPPLTAFLFCFAAVSYAVWLLIFGIYRYLIPLEMLAPLLIAMAIALWPMTSTIRTAIAVGLLLSLQAVVRMDIKRLDWGNSYVSVQLPSLPDPEHSMILMAGNAPMAFVIPSFPSSIPFLRIDGWLVWKDDLASGLSRQMHARVAAHSGPLLMLFADYEQSRAAESALAYGLKLVEKSCMPVRSNLTDPLQLCPLQRQAAASRPGS